MQLQLKFKMVWFVPFFCVCWSTLTIPSSPLPLLSPQVSVIKAKISDELGMPSGKQKLQMGVRLWEGRVMWACMLSDKLDIL